MLRDYAAAVRGFSTNARLYLGTSLLVGFSTGLLYLLFNLYVLSLGYDQAFVGLLASLPALVTAAAAVPAGIFLPRLGYRRALLDRTRRVRDGAARLGSLPDAPDPHRRVDRVGSRRRPHVGRRVAAHGRRQHGRDEDAPVRRAVRTQHVRFGRRQLPRRPADESPRRRRGWRERRLPGRPADGHGRGAPRLHPHPAPARHGARAACRSGRRADIGARIDRFSRDSSQSNSSRRSEPG